MQIICPHCGFEKDTSTSVIPAHAKTATCPKCGEKFNFRSFDDEDNNADKSTNNTDDNSELSHEELVEKAHTAYKEQMNYSATDDKEVTEEEKNKVHYRQIYIEIPWESTNPSLSLGYKFFETVKRVLFSAPQFFATMPRPFHISKAITFYVIIGVLEFVSRMFFLKASLGASLDSSTMQETLLAAITAPEVFLLGMLMAPAVLILRLVIYSAILFFVLRVIDTESADYYLVLRMLAYAYAPSVVCIVPAVGDLIAFPWIVFNVFIFCRHGLKVSLTRSEGSVMGKIIFCIIAFIVTLIALTLFASSIFNSMALVSVM